MLLLPNLLSARPSRLLERLNLPLQGRFLLVCLPDAPNAVRDEFGVPSESRIAFDLSSKRGLSPQRTHRWVTSRSAVTRVQERNGRPAELERP